MLKIPVRNEIQKQVECGYPGEHIHALLPADLRSLLELPGVQFLLTAIAVRLTFGYNAAYSIISSNKEVFYETS